MKPLSDFKSNITSYAGEDGILQELFRRIGAENKWCVEFGARDGYSASNTWNLIQNHGWRSVQIESDPREASALKKRYAGNKSVIAIKGFIQAHGPDSLDAILARAQAPDAPDLVVIDIDGHDYHIWKSLKGHRPRAVMIEYNETIAYPIEWVQKLKGPATGSSLFALQKLGKGMGYELVYAKYGNAIFVDAKAMKGMAPHAEDIMEQYPADYQVDRCGQFIQALDGSFVLYGSKNPSWIKKWSGLYKHPGAQCHIVNGEEVESISPNKESALVRKIKALRNRISS